MQGRRLPERLLIVFGGLLLAVSPFAPWAKVIILGNFDLLNLLDLAKQGPTQAYLLMAVGMIIVLVELLSQSPQFSRLVAVTLGAFISALSANLYFDLTHGLSQSQGAATLGVGVLLSIAGGIIIVTASLVGLVRAGKVDPEQPDETMARKPPAWLPLAIAVPIFLVLVLIPLQSSSGASCGNALNAIGRTPEQQPSSTPPASVQTQIASDQNALAVAQAALSAQQAKDQAAQNEQGAATDLANQAATADSNASNAESQVANDQSTLTSDQGTISGDQAQIQADQQQLAADQAAGYDTSSDLSQLAQDQATLARDQQTVFNDQITLAIDQATATASRQTADTLDAQAASAQGNANSAAQSTASRDEQAQQAADSAQSQLSNDQQSWTNTYDSQVSAVTTFNAFQSDCAAQGAPRATLSLLLLVAGGLASVLMLRGSRHTITKSS